jgi:hypothetical protein
MKEFKTTAVIQASEENIWKILTNLQDWPKWDPNCEKVEGTAGLGQKIKVFTKLSPGRAFPLKVSEFVPNRKMTWTGGMPLGLFKGERTYTLTPKGSGKVEFVMHEVFSGPLSPLIEKSIPDMTEAFQQFGLGLKSKAESAK